MSKKNPTSYDVSDEELVDHLLRASGKAGTATSGCCFDLTAGILVANMHFLKGVVLARLAGERPPYEPNDQVVVCDERGVSAKSYKDPSLPFNLKCVVFRVWYVAGDWYLELKGVVGESNITIYRASAFHPAKVENAPA